MTVAVPQDQQRKPDRVFDPSKISPSRVNNLLSCGIAFRLKYIDGVPAECSGSAALFGTVIHNALEKWAVNRSQGLVQLVRDAWLHATEGTVVKDFIALYGPLSIRAIQEEHRIREAWAAKGKESKAPRRTKEWKESDVGRAARLLMAEWHTKLTAGSFWKFNEWDPLPALYDESLVLAKRYQHRFGHLPPAIHTELAFNEPWEGFGLNGYIDEIELLIDRDSGELRAVLILDYKTYKNPPAEFKDWRQLVTYDIAFRALVARGVVVLPVPIEEIDILVGVDYVRWTDAWKDSDGNSFPPRKFWRVGPGDYERLLRECTTYREVVSNGLFMPAEKGRKPDFCDYPGQCCLTRTTAAGGESTPVEVVQ